MKKELTIPSTDKKNQLHVICWEPDKEIRAILQISHGMVEYVDRYDGFAKRLNEEGILVIGNDHLGHGLTALGDADLGYFGDGKSRTVVDDLYEVTKYAKKEYPDKPYFLFGHSMGSFMARRYLMTYGDEISGAIIAGTGTIKKSVLSLAGFVSGFLKLFRGERHRSGFLTNLSFSGYLSKIPNPRTSNDWLTRDEAVVDKYNSDKYCTYVFTINGYQTLFDALRYIQDAKNIKKIPKELPVYVISGKDDPVGDYGKGVELVYESYKDAGLKDITMKLYDGARHELTNETNKEEVFDDVKAWLEAHLT